MLTVGRNLYQTEYASRLKKEYDAPAYDVVSSIFRGLTGRKIIAPGAFSNHVGQTGVKCALKASEGILYPLEKYFFIVIELIIDISFSSLNPLFSSSWMISTTLHSPGTFSTFSMLIKQCRSKCPSNKNIRSHHRTKRNNARIPQFKQVHTQHPTLIPNH